MNREFIYTLPESIYLDNSLTLIELKLYMLIRSFMDCHQIFYASNKWIAKKLNTHPLSISRSLSNLVQKSYIIREETSQGRTLKIKQSEIILNDTLTGMLTPLNQNVNPPLNIPVNQEYQTVSIQNKDIIGGQNLCNSQDLTESDTEASTSPSSYSILFDKNYFLPTEELLLQIKDRATANCLDDITDDEIKQIAYYVLNQKKHDNLKAINVALKIYKAGDWKIPKKYLQMKAETNKVKQEEIIDKYQPTDEERELSQDYQYALKNKSLDIYFPDMKKRKKAKECYEKMCNINSNVVTIEKRTGNVAYGPKKIIQ